jgi:hypothetical protein
MNPTLLAMTLAAALCGGGPTNPVPAAPPPPAPVIAPPFRDVPPGHWASRAVERLRLAGIVIGYPEGSIPEAKEPAGPFSDVPTDH